MNKWKLAVIACLGIALASPLWYSEARDRVVASQSLKGRVGMVEVDIPDQWTWGPFSSGTQLWQHMNMSNCLCGLEKGSLVTAIAEDSDSVLVKREFGVPNPGVRSVFSLALLPRLQFARMVAAAANRPPPPPSLEELKELDEQRRREAQARLNRELERQKSQEVRVRILMRDL